MRHLDWTISHLMESPSSLACSRPTWQKNMGYPNKNWNNYIRLRQQRLSYIQYIHFLIWHHTKYDYATFRYANMTVSYSGFNDSKTFGCSKYQGHKLHLFWCSKSEHRCDSLVLWALVTDKTLCRSTSPENYSSIDHFLLKPLFRLIQKENETNINNENSNCNNILAMSCCQLEQICFQVLLGNETANIQQTAHTISHQQTIHIIYNTNSIHINHHFWVSIFNFRSGICNTTSFSW